MRALCIAALALLASACVSKSGQPTTSAHLLVGVKNYSDDFEPVETQPAVGTEFVLNTDGLGAEVGLNYSGDQSSQSGVDYKSENIELYAGPRYTWRVGRWRPYISAGLSALRATGDVTDPGGPDTSDDATKIGGYAGVGFDVEVSDALLGLVIRQTFLQELSLFGTDADAGATQLLVRAGFGF